MITDDNNPDASNDIGIAKLIAAYQARESVTDDEMAERLGYKSPAVIRMIKAGTMSLPINKIVLLARAIGADPRSLMRTYLAARMPGLLDAVQEVLPELQLEKHEIRLLKHLRSLANDSRYSPIVFGGKSVVALLSM